MYQALLYVLCLNLASYLLAAFNITPFVGYSGAVDIDQLTSSFNPSTPAESWTGWTGMVNMIGDIVGGLMMFWNAVQGLFIGFPIMLESLGAPTPVANVLKVLFGFVFFISFIEWRTGRSTGE